MFQILVAEDEPHLRKLISEALTNAGYQVIPAMDGKDAFDKFSEHYCDLVVSDVMMPNMDGFALNQAIKALNPEVPMLLLTALGEIQDKEKGFNSGADDYLVKPILMTELLLHIKALLRRYQITRAQRIELPHTLIDYAQSKVSVNGQDIEMTRKMFLVLFKLLSSPGKIFTRDDLMNEIWGYDTESDDRTVDTHIRWLREKILSPDFEIVTVRGLGYKAVLNDETKENDKHLR